MTTIYTKPQVDAMAVKIGGEIKAAKDGSIPSTQKGAVNGVASLGADGKVTPAQLPTAPVIPTFGTAATKDVGLAAGNVMEVSAFGLGGFANTDNPDTFKRNTFETYYKAGDPLNNEINAYITSAYSPDWVFQQRLSIGGSGNNIPEFRMFYNGTTWSPWRKYVIADTDGNAKVNAIQAGIGAPKLAYKKLTGTTGGTNIRTTIPHGLNNAKILGITAIVDAAGMLIPPNSIASGTQYTVDINGANLSILVNTDNTLVANKAIKILITYEV